LLPLFLPLYWTEDNLYILYIDPLFINGATFYLNNMHFEYHKVYRNFNPVSPILSHLTNNGNLFPQHLPHHRFLVNLIRNRGMDYRNLILWGLMNFRIPGNGSVNVVHFIHKQYECHFIKTFYKSPCSCNTSASLMYCGHLA